jgi:tRNA U34 5-carboxymethylaminomethyl modifying GTPase MnmE/TrmE
LNIIKNTTADEKTFVQRLAKSIVDLRVEDWNESNITTFMTGLKTFKETIENQDNTKIKKSDVVNEYQLTFVDNNGHAVTKTFEKSEYSNRAKLLLNEVTEAIESMGQSITENEKRQVLMEILEKLCK